MFSWHNNLENSCKQDIIENRSIAEALANEEKFFRSRPVDITFSYFNFVFSMYVFAS